RVLPFSLITLFALVWNGFTWPFFLSSLGNDTCATIFMIPFLLIGLGLGLAVVYTGLSIFNPRAALTLEPATPRLGEALKMHFTLSGRVDRIEKLKIVLEGIEQATYRRGTKTTTETSTFRRILLFETDQQFMMERGSASTVLPIDTMPSLKAGSSEIKWQIKVSGRIRRWPDMSDTFAVTIAPKAIDGRGADWLR
ncbi:MAG TPA: hypothetical protein PKB10_13620, partial [Tepidisphaeraceae bacterium]|nr:hypothetical protein [Tepidisphaeraceae bacterium]